MSAAEASLAGAAMVASFDRRERLQAMLDFEAALARAEARAGVIPADAADAIADKCDATLFDLDALDRQAAVAGLPTIPMTRMLTALVGGKAARWVHWGGTSQDVIDSAAMLQARAGFNLLIDDLREIGTACAELAEAHRATPMAGSTLLQQALPISFGLKAAQWLALTTRLLQRVTALRRDGLALQFGGAAGTLAALGAEDGLKVMALLAEELDLPAPDLPWQAQRDRIGEIAGGLGTVAGGMGKIAGDIILMMQTELGEVGEAPADGKGGSSTLPHKRNPVDALAAATAARLAIAQVPVLLNAMVQEHERAAGAWQAEWQALPELFRQTGTATAHLRQAVTGLQVDPDRMRANLEATGGQIMAEAAMMALAPMLGRLPAKDLVTRACRQAAAEGMDLKDVLAADPEVALALDAAALDRVFDPLAYLGAADTFINRALAAFRAATRA
jgi:3-carboxy-cis,cis-muconate cycloisomerase